MWRIAKRLLGYAAYGMVLSAAFVGASYLSFSSFIRGGETTVPNLVGLEPDEASTLLSEMQLELDIEGREPRYDEQVPAGRIAIQDPRPGSAVKEGSRVSAVLSLGAELVTVPDLRGQAVQAAQVTLAAVGLTLGRTVQIYSADARSGMVAEQSPPAGSEVGRSSAIELYVNADNPASVFLMPDLVYRDHETVRRFLDGRGFRVGSVKFEVYEGIPAGTVLRQFPLAGHPVGRGEVISMVVATNEGFES